MTYNEIYFHCVALKKKIFKKGEKVKGGWILTYTKTLILFTEMISFFFFFLMF